LAIIIFIPAAALKVATALAPACRITLLPEIERPKKISAVALKLYETIKGTPRGVGII
jgi:hypothetical protein